MRYTRLFTLSALFFTIALSYANDSLNWTQFRGNQAIGVSLQSTLPTEWDTESGKNILWQSDIPGLAHASPVIWGNHIFIATAVGPENAELKVGLYGDIEAADDKGSQQWRLLAVDKNSGDVVWNTLGYEGIPRSARHTKATHCNSTPATDGKYIVAAFGSEGLFCFDLQGERKWHKDLGELDAGFFVVPTAQWGYASSPVIHDGKVVVLCDVQKGSFLACYDLETGNEIWKTPREDVPTWGTPTIVEVDGQTQILVNGWHHTGAYHFATGKEIWKLDGGGDIPTPTPIVAFGLAYFTSAHGNHRPIRAIRLTATGDITPPKIEDTNEHIAWVHDKMGNYMQTPIVVGDYIYACYDNGVLSCFDAKTGEVQYRERLNGGGYTSSPISDGNHIYFAGETGNVFVVPANGKFSITSKNNIGGNCLATPAISGNVIYFRTQHKLIAVGAK